MFVAGNAGDTETNVVNASGADDGNPVSEEQLMIVTDDGSMGTFVVHFETDTAPHTGFPVVLFLMDSPGKRPLLHDMARRIAERCYYVMLHNLYYRTTESFSLDFESKESFQRMSELMLGVGNRMVARDAAALLACAGDGPLADASRVGVVGLPHE